MEILNWEYNIYHPAHDVVHSQPNWLKNGLTHHSSQNFQNYEKCQEVILNHGYDVQGLGFPNEWCNTVQLETKLCANEQALLPTSSEGAVSTPFQYAQSRRLVSKKQNMKYIRNVTCIDYSI